MDLERKSLSLLPQLSLIMKQRQSPSPCLSATYAAVAVSSDKVCVVHLIL